VSDRASDQHLALGPYDRLLNRLTLRRQHILSWRDGLGETRAAEPKKINARTPTDKVVYRQESNEPKEATDSADAGAPTAGPWTWCRRWRRWRQNDRRRLIGNNRRQHQCCAYCCAQKSFHCHLQIDRKFFNPRQREFIASIRSARRSAGEWLNLATVSVN